MIAITVNGEQRTARPGSTVTDLLHEMGLEGEVGEALHGGLSF